MSGPEETAIVVAVDAAQGGLRRAHFAGTAEGLRRGEPLEPVSETFDGPAGSPERVLVFFYPTRAHEEGLGGRLFARLSPEDRALARRLERRFPGKVECRRVGLSETSVFEAAGVLLDESERERYRREREGEGRTAEASEGAWLRFDPSVLRHMGQAFKSSMTRPSRQDYTWLATKTFGLNLAIRLAFVLQSVHAGRLAPFRAAASTLWYQLQDAVFTVFGQTYMKFLGKMTGLLRVGRAQVGDFAFVYVQLCLFEFLNRLVLGPLGENPLATTPRGLALIFVNILQGMASGGPLIPAINQMRRSGVIRHSTMMHLYQLSSLTMHLGLFASFGYQGVYAALTGAIFVFSWGSYFFFSAAFKDPELGPSGDPELLARLDDFALPLLKP